MGLALTHGRKAASLTARRITSREPDRNWAVTFMLTLMHRGREAPPMMKDNGRAVASG